MSTRIYGTTSILLNWNYLSGVAFGVAGPNAILQSWDYLSTLDLNEIGSDGDYVRIDVLGGAVGTEYVNRVWDPLEGVGGEFVRWTTYYIDSGGQEYPGPSSYPAVSGSYALESIKFGRA